eukprot:862903-Rhodomonas_salina.2
MHASEPDQHVPRRNLSLVRSRRFAFAFPRSRAQRFRSIMLAIGRKGAYVGRNVSAGVGQQGRVCRVWVLADHAAGNMPPG